MIKLTEALQSVLDEEKTCNAKLENIDGAITTARTEIEDISIELGALEEIIDDELAGVALGKKVSTGPTPSQKKKVRLLEQRSAAEARLRGLVKRRSTVEEQLAELAERLPAAMNPWRSQAIAAFKERAVPVLTQAAEMLLEGKALFAALDYGTGGIGRMHICDPIDGNETMFSPGMNWRLHPAAVAAFEEYQGLAQLQRRLDRVADNVKTRTARPPKPEEAIKRLNIDMRTSKAGGDGEPETEPADSWVSVKSDDPTQT
jgi:chaperonin cofactor prefoldin